MNERKIVHYGLIQAIDYNKFYDTVNGRIKEGWEPLGGVSTVVEDGSITFTQAVVKYE